MIIVALAIKLESAGSRFEQADLHWTRRPAFQMLQISDHHPRSEARDTGVARNTHRSVSFSGHRIEALPQLINVLRGDMRLIRSGGGLTSVLD